MTGLYYFHDLESEEASFTSVTTDSYSGFGETHLEFLPASHLILGLRYTDEEKALSVTPGYYTQPEQPGTAVPPLTAEPDKWFSQLTYRVGLDHKFDNGVLVYASKNLGFKSGGYNTTEPSLPNFEPEKLNAYEVGLKSEWFDHRLRWNGAAYYYDYANIQMTKLTSNNQIQEYNGPPATVYGTDFDAEAVIVKDLTLNLGASYIHDRFTAASPTVQWNVSGWFGEPDNQLRQAAYNTVNAGVYWHVKNGPFTVGLWGRNLTHALVYTAVQGNALTSLAQYAPPRTYGVKLSADLP